MNSLEWIMAAFALLITAAAIWGLRNGYGFDDEEHYYGRNNNKNGGDNADHLE